MLHRQPEVRAYGEAGVVDVLQVAQNSRPVVPRRPLRSRHYVVAFGRRDRNAMSVQNAEAARQSSAKSVATAVKTSSE